METNLTGVIVAAVVGGIVGSGATLAVGRAVTPRPDATVSTAHSKSSRGRVTHETSVAPETRRDSNSAATDQRVALLERKVKILTAALAQQGREGDGGAANSPRSVDVADPVFEVAVMDIIDRVEAQKQEERDTRRTQMRQQFANRMSDELGTTLDLNDVQKEKLATVVSEHFDAIRALRDAEDRPVTRAEWRERIGAITQASEKKLEEFLSPGQLQSYRDLDEADRIGGGWNRGGRGQRGR